MYSVFWRLRSTPSDTRSDIPGTVLSFCMLLHEIYTIRHTVRPHVILLRVCVLHLLHIGLIIRQHTWCIIWFGALHIHHRHTVRPKKLIQRSPSPFWCLRMQVTQYGKRSDVATIDIKPIF